MLGVILQKLKSHISVFVCIFTFCWQTLRMGSCLYLVLGGGYQLYSFIFVLSIESVLNSTYKSMLSIFLPTTLS